jgi:hypothetical protein
MPEPTQMIHILPQILAEVITPVRKNPIKTHFSIVFYAIATTAL